MIKQYPNSTKLLFLYGTFLQNILDDEEHGAKYLAK
jgi:hypothetical protein